MANSAKILDKIKRNLDMLGVTATRGATSVTVDDCTISYSDASIEGPMGGVSASSSPYLGIGVAAPGKIVFKGATGEDTVALIMTSEGRLKALRVCCAFANNVIVQDGDSTDTLAELPGSPDHVGLGE
jgi:hypothetical protein